MRRNRAAYLVSLAMVIIAGLASRSSVAVYLPSFVATYAGDTLWALALFLTICIAFPGMRLRVVVALTLSFSFAVEFSQLYRADWLNAIRDTRIGALLLGSGFKWSDLVCYTTGCLAGATCELLASRRAASIGHAGRGPS